MSPIISISFSPRRCEALYAAARWAENRTGLCAALLFAAAFLSPQLAGSYGGDDVLNSLTPGLLLIRGISLNEFLASYIHGWMFGGRFFPIALIMAYGVHYVIPSAAIFHIFVFSLILCDLVLFYVLLRSWRIESALASLAVLMLAVLFQMRFFYDPILQFAGLLPLLTAEILISLITFDRYLASSRAGWLAASLVAFALSLVTYEIAFTIAPAFYLMAHARFGNWRRSVAANQLHLTLIVLITAFTLGLRTHTNWTADNAYCPRFDVTAILKTTAAQASAALPLSYWLASENCLDSLQDRAFVGEWRNWLIGLAAGVLTVTFLRQYAAGNPSERKANWKLLSLVGLTIWVTPGALIAMSQKYQTIVAPGIGYIPVFLQSFGFAVIVIAGVLLAQTRFSRCWPQFACSLAVFNAAAAMITYHANVGVVARFTAQPLQREMALIEAACGAGLCDSLPAGAIISSFAPHVWLQAEPEFAGAHFAKLLRRPIFATIGPPTQEWLDRRQAAGALVGPIYAMNDAWRDDGGHVILGAVESSAVAAGDEHHLCQFKLFLRGRDAELSRRPGQLLLEFLPDENQESKTAAPNSSIDLSQLEMVAKTDEGITLEGRFPGPVAISSVRVVESHDADIHRLEKLNLARR